MARRKAKANNNSGPVGTAIPNHPTIKNPSHVATAKPGDANAQDLEKATERKLAALTQHWQDLTKYEIEAALWEASVGLELARTGPGPGFTLWDDEEGRKRLASSTATDILSVVMDRYLGELQVVRLAMKLDHTDEEEIKELERMREEEPERLARLKDAHIRKVIKHLELIRPDGATKDGLPPKPPPFVVSAEVQKLEGSRNGSSASMLVQRIREGREQRKAPKSLAEDLTQGRGPPDESRGYDDGRPIVLTNSDMNFFSAEVILSLASKGRARFPFNSPVNHSVCLTCRSHGTPVNEAYKIHGEPNGISEAWLTFRARLQNHVNMRVRFEQLAMEKREFQNALYHLDEESLLKLELEMKRELEKKTKDVKGKGRA
ncbi:MAG: hypothetical protein M1823_000287 [Watsoniomyces obsoletus]|nr:MAG: hypothetical protein M1823_000287 [Watsoniomyces obsoletus]